PVYLDADFLLGPEAAHLNISGVSGLATKTSAVEFLLASIFQHFPAHKGRVAALCFNVKGPDLCFLDRPGALDDADRRRYERLGITPQPFERVRYYAPFKADGVTFNTLRTHPDLVGDVDPLGQDLVFARAVSKLREHLERRDLGVEAVVVFVDELNKYAPGDGPETYVRKMLLDISERGRYLGLVLFAAEQFRSQVHRRVVGNA